MSIVKLRKGVRKQIKFKLFGKTHEFGSAMAIILWIIVLIFLLGTYYMYRPSSGGGQQGRQATTRKVDAVIAKADGAAISRQEYEYRVYLAGKAQGSSDVTRLRYTKTSILDSLVDRELQRAAAKAEGIKVTSADIAAKKDEIVEEMLANQYGDKAVLHKVLKERNVSLDEFKNQLRNDDRMPDNKQLREMILFEKLQDSVEASVSVSEADVRDSYREVHARHILISPDDIISEALATASEANDGSDETVTPPEPMTEEEAKAKAREIADDLKKQLDEGADFAKLAEEYSDDPGSAANGGDLDFFTRDRMIKEFSDVAFALKPGEISDPVETQFGVHIIKVEETRDALPEDFDANKQKYTDEVTKKLKDQAWQKYQQDLRDAATIEILDPELQAYKLLEKDPTGASAEAEQLLALAAEQDPRNDSARYELAMLLDQSGQTDEAIATLTELAESEGSARSAQVHMQLAKMLKDAGQNDEAIAQFKSASEWAQGFDYPNYFVHMEAQRLLNELGATDAAAAEQEWLDDFNEQMGGGMGSPGTINVN